MSAQPLTRSSDNSEDSKWHELIKFAELLITQSDLESQLAYLISTFERIFSCKASLWLEDLYSIILRDDVMRENHINLMNLSDLMVKARDSKKIYHQPKPDSNLADLPSSIALPMLIREEIIGVIQLDRSDGSGFDYQDCEFIYGLGLHCSLAIDWKRQEIVNSDQSRIIELLTSTTQISKSITSNLDLDNLINSVISHLHQRFGFSKVNLFMVQGEPNQALYRVGITDQGIEPSDLYYYDRDST